MPPPISHTQKTLSEGRTSRNFDRSEKDHAAQRGRDAFGSAPPGQDPKAAKFAVLPPGHAGFPKRAERSEGSDSTPVRKAPVSACKPLCAILLAKVSVYPLLLVKANVGRLCEKLKNALKSGLEQRCNSNFLAIFVEVILWFFDRLRKAPALLAPEPSLSLTSQVQRKF